MTGSTGTTPRTPRRRPALRTRWGLVLVLLPLVATVAPAWVTLEGYEIDGPSNAPTLLHGDRVAAGRLAYGLWLPLTRRAAITWAAPELGDMVVARTPDGLDVVKRVVGLAGDTIEIRDDLVYRNGAPLARVPVGPPHDEAPELVFEERASDERAWLVGFFELMGEHSPPVRVPPGHAYLLGDHRDRSNDSRNPRIGPVPYERIRGRVHVIYWSDGGEGVRWERIGEVVR